MGGVREARFLCIFTLCTKRDLKKKRQIISLPVWLNQGVLTTSSELAYNVVEETWNDSPTALNLKPHTKRDTVWAGFHRFNFIYRFGISKGNGTSADLRPDPFRTQWLTYGVQILKRGRYSEHYTCSPSLNTSYSDRPEESSRAGENAQETTHLSGHLISNCVID